MAEWEMDDGISVTMGRVTDPPGVDVVDPIERRRCTLLTPEAVTLREGDPDAFRFPVDAAVEIETSTITAPLTGHLWVRDANGDVIGQTVGGVESTFPPATYSLELSGLIKVYLDVDSAFEVTNSEDTVEISFPERTTVTIGSRSPHTRPATTVTTTDTPRDLLRAISTFGSALKSTTPERAFPTLRGHPPEIELGRTCEIPDGLEPPVDDVWIEVPPSYEYIYPVAPLAYYLGVRAEPGPTARIVGEDLEFALHHPLGYAHAVHEVLQRVFFLECVSRTEGLYPVDLAARERFEERVSLPHDRLYEASVLERLRAYLEVPFHTVEDLLPDWRLAAHVGRDPDNIEMMPYLANDLALVTMADGDVLPSEAIVTGMTGGFTRGGGTTRGTDGGTMSLGPFVRPQNAPPAIETAWVSDGTPISATKAIPSAYRNRFGRQLTDQRIEIAVVCNSPDMADESDIVDQVYGNRDVWPFDVELYEGLTTERLEALLRRDFNFLHYVGHIDAGGFRCSDGRLDISSFDEIGAEAFFLNACQSYEQGVGLIDAGAIGGIVTLNEVVNEEAVAIGRAVARLLDSGFPLRGALDIASARSAIGSQYLVVGDGTLSIVEPPSGTPQMYRLVRHPDDPPFGIEIEGFGAPPGMGCLFTPYIEATSRSYLAGGRTEEFRIDADELRTFLRMENVPVEIGGEVVWSYDVDPESV